MLKCDTWMLPLENLTITDIWDGFGKLPIPPLYNIVVLNCNWGNQGWLNQPNEHIFGSSTLTLQLWLFNSISPMCIPVSFRFALGDSTALSETIATELMTEPMLTTDTALHLQSHCGFCWMSVITKDETNLNIKLDIINYVNTVYQQVPTADPAVLAKTIGWVLLRV